MQFGKKLPVWKRLSYRLSKCYLTLSRWKFPIEDMTIVNISLCMLKQLLQDFLVNLRRMPQNCQKTMKKRSLIAVSWVCSLKESLFEISYKILSLKGHWEAHTETSYSIPGLVLKALDYKVALGRQIRSYPSSTILQGSSFCIRTTQCVFIGKNERLGNTFWK